MREPGNVTNRSTRRSAQSWIVLSLRLLSLASFIAALMTEHGVRWVMISFALGLVVLPIAIRRKASTVAGALWTASADLLEGGTHHPGQLSLLPNSLIWIPSNSARRHGKYDLNLPLSSNSNLQLESGAALMDVFVDVIPKGGEHLRFLTHRSARLRRAFHLLGQRDSS